MQIIDTKEEQEAFGVAYAKGVLKVLDMEWKPPAKVLYGVVGQKIDLSDRKAAEKYAVQLNAQEKDGWYWKVQKIEGTNLCGVMGQQIALSDRSKAEIYTKQLNSQESAKPKAERWFWKVITIRI